LRKQIEKISQKKGEKPMSELKKVKELRDLFEKKKGENNVILFK
jgi:hypothetical protein